MERLVIVGELAGDGDFRRLLESEGFDVRPSDELDGAALVILSRRLGDDLSLIDDLRAVDPRREVIVVSTRSDGVELLTDPRSRRAAADALDRGALDYLRRPVSLRQLRVALDCARRARTLSAPPDAIAAE